MLSIGVQETEHIAGNLQEIFVSISVPRHPQAQKMLKFWHKRPAEGFLMERDIPATGADSPLNHVIAWQPAHGMSDFVVRHVGKALHTRFSAPPDSLVGRRMSQLLSEELFAYLRHVCPQILSQNRIEALDIGQCHNGFEYMHYEMLIFPATDADAEPWLITSLFYF